MVRTIGVVLLSLLLEACTKPSAHEPVTLTFLEEWSNETFSEARQQELQQFTHETGIRVNLLPSPESARQKLVSVAIRRLAPFQKTLPELPKQSRHSALPVYFRTLPRL
jgi:hypothetical protein